MISWLIEALDSSFMTVWHGIAERGLHYSVHSAEIIIHIKKNEIWLHTTEYTKIIPNYQSLNHERQNVSSMLPEDTFMTSQS